MHKFIIILILNILFNAISAYCHIIKVQIDNNILPYSNNEMIYQNIGATSILHNNLQTNTSKGNYKSNLRSIVDLRLQNINDPNTILHNKKHKISDIVVQPSKRKAYILGPRNPGKTTWAWCNILKGAEIGRLITNKDKIVICKFYFYIRETNCDSILYKLKFFNIKNQMPDSIINNEEILFKSKEKKGWESICLFNYNIIINHDFIVTLEIVNSWGNVKEKSIHLSKLRNRGISYKRQSSHIPWLKFAGEMSYKLEVSKL
ncbi:MAG: hypothetical protein PHS48_02600 [Bacteroidales bacterium]|nr:hypothetical protein [Bacteroidales bacterium]